jgi:hypothetical protein
MALANNTLDRVLNSYYFTLDALTITDRLIDISNANPSVTSVLLRTQYALSSRDAVTTELCRCYELWEDYVILALWAEFERALVHFISTRFPYSLQPKDTHTLQSAIVKAHDKFIERAFTDDRINLFKKIVSDDLLTVTHQIKEYRNWVAHQNPNRGRPKKVDAETAYLYLSYFLEAIDQFT